MRTEPSILHLDLDAFFAAVEQRDKPSLRGKPVIVGGLGPRGVVSTASYEARLFGVRSAMRMAEARSRCPHAAFLAGRFAAYRNTSHEVMTVLHTLSPLVEPLSLDEAFVDLAAGPDHGRSVAGVTTLAERLKHTVTEVTGGLTASVGAATSKLVAKIASDLNKPDGLYVVASGTERELLAPMPVSRLPGVGPATRERLHRMGIQTVGSLSEADEDELVSALGHAHGHGLARLARAEDDRPVVSERESKSVSVEDTFDTDIVDPERLALITDRLAARVCTRLREDRLSGRTITVKIRLYDFTTHTRSNTLSGPTDDVRVVTRIARRLLTEVDTSLGVRLLGVGLSGLADWVQDDLFSGGDDQRGTDGPEYAAEPAESRANAGANGSAGEEAHALNANAPRTDTESADTESADGPRPAESVANKPSMTASGDADVSARVTEASHAGPVEGARPTSPWVPGADVVHAELGRGWVWGRGLGRVTVRFETAESTDGPVRTFADDDPRLQPWTPEPAPEPETAPSHMPAAGLPAASEESATELIVERNAGIRANTEPAATPDPAAHPAQDGAGTDVPHSPGPSTTG